MNSTDESGSRRPRFVGAIIVGLGLFFLATGLNRPSIATMRTVDLVHLLATGGLLGAGLVALVVNISRHRNAVKPSASTQGAKSPSH